MPRKTTRSQKAIQQQRKLADSPHKMGGFGNALAMLPVGDEALLSHAAFRLDQFNDAMLCDDAKAIEAAELFYWASVYRLNGDTAWACAVAGGGLDKVQKHLAPALGVPTRWGERGEWLLEVGDMRLWVRVGCSSLGGGHGVNLHAVDADAPFLNAHGEQHVRLWPDACRGLDFVRALRQEVERLLAGECPPVALEQGVRERLQLPEWMEPALEGVTHNGQHALALSGRIAAPVAEVAPEPEPKAPMSNKERQRLFRQRQKQRRDQAKAEGVRTLELEDVDLARLWIALDTHLAFNKLLDWDLKGHLETAAKLFSDQPAAYLDQLGTSQGVVNQQKQRDKDAKRGWDAYKEERKRTDGLVAKVNDLQAENARLKAALAEIGAEFGIQTKSTNQQIDKSTFEPAAPVVTPEPQAFSLQIVRQQRLKGGREDGVALAEVKVVPHEGRWMWAASLNSQNGSSSGYAPLPKWGKFAATPGEALQRGLVEVREFRERVTPAERKRLDAWLAGEAAERLAQLGVAFEVEGNKSTNQQMLMI